MTAATTRPPGHVALPDAEQARHALRMRELIYGHLRSRALCAMAELGLADALAERPLPAAELADRAGADPALLTRLLHALAAFGALRATSGQSGSSGPSGSSGSSGPSGEAVQAGRPGEFFELTPLGAALRTDAPASALPTALLVARAVAPAWERLTESVRTGRPGFPEAFGEDFFSRLGADPALRSVFDRSQETGLALELAAVLDAVDFSGALTVVDVGGGDAALLTGLLAANPELRGVLVDLAEALEPAARRLAGTGLGARCELVAGDFFAPLPPGADRYLLRHILHDWDDDACRALLRNCRAAMGPEARLVVVDHLAGADPAGGDRWGAVMDLYMMSLFGGGRERTREEVTGLLHEAGFGAVRVTRLAAGAGVFEARPGDGRPAGGGPR